MATINRLEKRAATSRKRTKRTSHLANPYRFKCDQVLLFFVKLIEYLYDTHKPFRALSCVTSNLSLTLAFHRRRRERGLH